METKFPYNKIIKQAFYITKTHRWLWVFGFLLYFFRGLLPEILIIRAEQAYSLSYLESILSSPALFLGALVIIILTALLSLYASSISESVMLKGVQEIIKKEKQGRRSLFNKSFHYAFPLTWLGLSILAFLLLISGVLGLPVYYLGEQAMTEQASVLALIAIAIFIFLFAAASIVWVLASIFIVLTDQNLLKSVNLAVELFKKKWLACLVLLAVSMGIVSVPGIISALFLPLSGLVTVALFLLLESLAVTLIMTIWVLAWREFTKTTLLEAEEKALADQGTKPVPT